MGSGRPHQYVTVRNNLKGRVRRLSSGDVPSRDIVIGITPCPATDVWASPPRTRSRSRSNTTASRTSPTSYSISTGCEVRYPSYRHGLDPQQHSQRCVSTISSVRPARAGSNIYVENNRVLAGQGGSGPVEPRWVLASNMVFETTWVNRHSGKIRAGVVCSLCVTRMAPPSQQHNPSHQA
jgi:hypothetical protein